MVRALTDVDSAGEAKVCGTRAGAEGNKAGVCGAEAGADGTWMHNSPEALEDGIRVGPTEVRMTQCVVCHNAGT